MLISKSSILYLCGAITLPEGAFRLNDYLISEGRGNEKGEMVPHRECDLGSIRGWF